MGQWLEKHPLAPKLPPVTVEFALICIGWASMSMCAPMDSCAGMKFLPCMCTMTETKIGIMFHLSDYGLPRIWTWCSQLHSSVDKLTLVARTCCEKTCKTAIPICNPFAHNTAKHNADLAGPDPYTTHQADLMPPEISYSVLVRYSL